MTGPIRWSLALALSLTCPSISADAPAADRLQRVVEELVPPPDLPKHEQVDNGPPKIIEVRLTVQEKQVVVDDSGTKTWVMTYNGSIPGPIIVVHQDDYVELTLVNPAGNTLMHNIDFHAATGGLGGGALTLVAPGQEAVMRFKAIKPGVFVYHCAPGGMMIPWHVVSGMNGAIMVLPRGGLKDASGKPVHYDRAYYIGEQDFYLPRDTDGKYKAYPTPVAGMADTLAVMRSLTPTHVVFEGRVGALTGEHALTAKVGEKVLFIHSEANMDARPHLVGGHGDLVWRGGSFNDTPATNLETWLVEGGSAGAMLYQFRQPGEYSYLDHNLIVASLLGASATVKVEGKWDDDLMTAIKAPNLKAGAAGAH